MGRYISTAIVPLVRTVSASSNYSAQVNDRILADTTSGSFTITLPDALLEGDTIQIIDIQSNFGTNNLIIDRNSNNINGAGNNLTADVNGVILTLTYINPTLGWIITST